MKIEIVNANSEHDLAEAFATLAQIHADALMVHIDALFLSHRDQIVALAARYAVPAIYPQREFAAPGGLISYGTNVSELNRQAGMYVGQILKGTKPTDLPVMQPTKFELVINLKTAKALVLTIPQSLLATADEVIE